MITDQAGWETLWQQHMSYSHNPLPLPQVDFAKEMVIAVFGGIKSEGYMLQITKIEQEKGELVVHYSLVGPCCTKCSLPTGMIQPFHIVKLERLELPVIFRRL